MTAITREERRRRYKLKREREQKINEIGCQVWERSGIPEKKYPAWLVVDNAIDTAVKVTYVDGINDEAWITSAINVFLEAIKLGNDQ